MQAEEVKSNQSGTESKKNLFPQSEITWITGGGVVSGADGICTGRSGSFWNHRRGMGNGYK